MSDIDIVLVKRTPGQVVIKMFLAGAPEHFLIMTCTNIGGGKSKLHMECDDEHWPHLEPYWSDMVTAMRRDGLLS